MHAVHASCSLSKSVGARRAARWLLVAAPPCPSNTAASLMLALTAVVNAYHTYHTLPSAGMVRLVHSTRSSICGAQRCVRCTTPPRLGRTSGRRPRAAHVPHKGCAETVHGAATMNNSVSRGAAIDHGTFTSDRLDGKRVGQTRRAMCARIIYYFTPLSDWSHQPSFCCSPTTPPARPAPPPPARPQKDCKTYAQGSSQTQTPPATPGTEAWAAGPC